MAEANYASYFPNESPTLLLQLQSLYLLNGRHKQETTWNFDLRLFAEHSTEPLYTKSVELHESRELLIERLPTNVVIEPGFYKLSCRAESSKGEVRSFQQGFWGFSTELLEQGTPLKANRDYFEKDDRPFPIVGMTYMTSDVARKFLWLPNASVWDRDMAHMKRAGINHIRTGIWTGYRQVMFVDGHPYEEVLRSIDAFVLTAAKHELDLCFTFFGFTPEAWEGKNPYLDPRSVEAQKRFVASIVSRYKQATHIHWDLINEPSMFDPARVFAGPRSAQDPFERKAFQNWLKDKYETVRVLQEKWNMTIDELPDFESVQLPEQADISFDIQDMRFPKKKFALDGLYAVYDGYAQSLG